jgi:hypothetical protein
MLALATQASLTRSGRQGRRKGLARGAGDTAAMHRALLLAASLSLLFAADHRTRAARDPRGPRYGAGYDPIAEALGRVSPR